MGKMSHSMISNDYLRWIFRAWRYRLLIEKPEIIFLLNHLKLGQVVLDIGAHKGAYTYWMSNRVGESGRVIAFEPQPELNSYLSKISSHVPTKNIYVESKAIHRVSMTLPILNNAKNRIIGIVSRFQYIPPMG